MTLSFTITDTKFATFPIRENIDWPIIKKTEKAYLVRTPGGDLWIPIWKIMKTSYYLNDVAELIDFLTIITSQSADHVSVVKSGEGPTEKSAKYKVKVNRKSHDRMESQFPVTKVVERCFTLAKSQIEDDGGNLSAPLWLFKDRLNEGESLLRGEWQGLDRVVAQINQVADNVRTRSEQEKEKVEAETKARIAASLKVKFEKRLERT